VASVPAFLNGRYLPLEDCTISVLDRGFVFGDGIYELFTVYNKQPFCLEQHLNRLQRSLAEVKIDSPYSEEDWRKLIFAMANALPLVPAEQLQNGVELVTCEDIRWQRCDIKVTSLLANILAKQHAAESSAIEAIMIRDDCALEGSASNLFVVREGVVYTHPKDNLILPGVTRDFVLQLLQELNIEYHEQAIPKDWLFLADEVWITSSTKEVIAATKIDKQVVANGKPGMLWEKTYQLYQQRKM